MISRRQFVYGSVLALAGCRSDHAANSGRTSNARSPGGDYPFRLGIASGDPTSDSVVLWTRLAPLPLSDSYLTEAVSVSWVVATDAGLRDVLQAGETLALPANAHCVHVLADGLEPGAVYYYQFSANGYSSQPGRTRTLPLPGVELEKFSVALTSCQEYSQGYFSAYRDLLARDPDIVIHNGDYIYEAPSGNVRPYPVSPEAITLADYRSLYAQYRQDVDLRQAHARFPWFVIWDDHEVVNDWGPNHYLPSSRNRHLSDGEHQTRRRAATKAFLEHMPLRASLAGSAGESPVFYRRSVVGDLLEISHIDVRSYRDRPACSEDLGMRFVDCNEVHQTNRSMLGHTQEQWLYQNFGTSACRWNCLSQATIMAAFDRTAGPEVSYETDSWDNYPANRSRILDHVSRNKIRNCVSLGGNIHAFYAGVVSAEQGIGRCDPVLTELVTTSITATGGSIERLNDINGRREENPCIGFFENRFRGYMFLEFMHDKIAASLRMVDDIKTPGGHFSTLASMTIEDGKTGVRMSEATKSNRAA